MATNNMDNGTTWIGTDGVAGTAFTVILFFIARFTLTDFAAIATIIAGLSTVALNIYRVHSLKKRQADERNREQDEQA